MSKRNKKQKVRSSTPDISSAKPLCLDLRAMKTFVMRLAGAVVALIVIFYLLGTIYLSAVLPLYGRILARIQPGYEVQSLQAVKSNIELDVTVRRQITDESGALVNARRSVRVSISKATAYIQPIILFSILLACPVRSRQKKIKSILFGAVFVFFAGMIDIPWILAWEVEDVIAADSPGSLRTIAFMGLEVATRTQDNPLLTYWYVFIQTGGRQFLGVLGSIICMLPPQNTQAPRYPSKSQLPTPKQTQ